MGLTEQEERNLGWPFYAHQLDVDTEIECCSCGDGDKEPEEVDHDDRREQRTTI